MVLPTTNDRVPSFLGGHPLSLEGALGHRYYTDVVWCNHALLRPEEVTDHVNHYTKATKLLALALD